MKLIIGNKNYSPHSLRPWLLLSHFQLPFEEILIPLDKDDTHTQLTRYTATDQVPVLHDDNLIIWDSLAICEYISERYLRGQGWPDNDQDRAQARSYCAELHADFALINQCLPMNCRASERKVPFTSQLEHVVTRIDAIWSTLREKHMSDGPWLTGNFSIVDCMFAPVVLQFSTYQIPVTQLSLDYMNTTLNNIHLQLWKAQAKTETDFIASYEVGF